MIPKGKHNKQKRRTLIVNVVSVKGGTGKSVISLALALWLARREEIGRVIYMDADFSGTCTRKGLGDDAFNKEIHKSRDDGQARYLDELVQVISFSDALKHHGSFFEQFGEPRLGEKLLLAFSGKDHSGAQRLTSFFDVEHDTHMVLDRMLQLAGGALKDVARGVIVLDNGPGIYGISHDLLDLDAELNQFLSSRCLDSLLGDVRGTHLFVATPDRQDVEGTAELVRDYYTRNLLYHIAMNCSRRGWSEKVTNDMRTELVECFSEFKDIENHFSLIPDSDFFRIFVKPGLGGTPIWDDDKWLNPQWREVLRKLSETFFEPLLKEFMKNA